MNREEKIADLVQRWIPDELRLDTRHDARLVSSAITTVIMAVYDSDRMTMVGQSSDVSAALKTWFDTTFAEHMRAEDDHMQSLEEKASRAMPVITVLSTEDTTPDDRDMSVDEFGNPVEGESPYSETYKEFTVRFKDSREATNDDYPPTAHVVTRDGKRFRADIIPYRQGMKGVTGFGASVDSAFSDAARKTGAMVRR